MGLDSQDNNRFKIGTNLLGLGDRLIIDPSGNVGIGTANPAGKLHVAGGVYVQDYIHIKSTTVPGSQKTWSPWVAESGFFYILDVDAGINRLSIDPANGCVTAVNIPCSSDVVFKKNIAPIDSALDKILGLKGVSYEWKLDEYKNRGFTEGRHYGVIAQEAEKATPELVKGKEGDKSVLYMEMIPVLIEAVKEQHVIIEGLKAKVQQLEAKGITAKVQ